MRQARSGLGAAAAVAVALTCGSPARAQMDSREAIALQNQILELRRDIQILSQQSAGRPAYAPPGYSAPAYPPPGGGGMSSDLATQLLSRVAALEESVRDLRGRVEQMQNTAGQRYDDLAKQIADINFRLGAGGAAAAPPAPGLPPSALAPGATSLQPSAAQPGSPAVPRRPETALQEGNAALARRDYPAAEAAAREVLGNTRGPRAIDAQFLLAQALAGQRNFQGAAVAYDDTFKRAPAGAHAQDSLLGIAVSLNALGAKRESCEALAELRASFPTPRPDLREPIAAARERAGCR
ncbi:MAG: hypothetical protein JO326_09610 [Acetobacteraceae bacterium]|nr:hypothetical protein [Acetobacteraceae bacterium]